MQRIIARYKITPEQAQEHERLTVKVLQELRAQSPAGVRCLVLQFQDGSYVQVAALEEGASALATLDNFRSLQSGIAERCLKPLKLSAEVGVLGLDRSPRSADECGLELPSAVAVQLWPQLGEMPFEITATSRPVGHRERVRSRSICAFSLPRCQKFLASGLRLIDVRDGLKESARGFF
jgi:hypothetical protein